MNKKGIIIQFLTNQLITRHSLEDFADFNKGNGLKYHMPVKAWNLGPEEGYFFRMFEYLSKIVLETYIGKITSWFWQFVSLLILKAEAWDAKDIYFWDFAMYV